MKLGFCSAILPDLPLEQVLGFAAANGFSCVELMCWPLGRAERRYAGVTHIDVVGLGKTEATRIRELLSGSGTEISGLGYYPNPLVPDPGEARIYIEHIKKVIRAAELLEVPVVNTFIGRNHNLPLRDNWPLFEKRWPPIVRFAERSGVRIAIENCPMLFTDDEWPGGKNMAFSPAIWRRMFEFIPSKNFGLNYDPSHLIWQHMDYLKPIREFADHLLHVHAKDARLDVDRLNDVGILANPNEYHTPKLPGLGDVDWGGFFSALTDAGYDGAICVEVEDRAYEGTLVKRKAALRQSAAFLRQFLG